MIRRNAPIAVVVAGMAATVTLSQASERKGLVRNTKEAFEGYTLFAPLTSTTTYLIDMRGNVVHEWKGEYPPGQAVYLLENGHLLKTAHGRETGDFHGGGLGGLIREFDWDGKLVWDFPYCDSKRCQHHDIEPLPNGNVLVIAWEKKTAAEAVAAGRDPDCLPGDELWPDHVIEVKPEGKRGGRIVWEWHVWDHLVQDFDKSKANYGVVKNHPELIDVNFVQGARQNVALPPDELRRLQALGYISGAPAPGPGPDHADWNHTNSIAYNAELDQILLSVLGFNEIWIIDHGTTTKEAAGHAGGKRGKGGDLLYRWGNPEAYGAASAARQWLLAQHDALWIPAGSPGAGHILVFNNGRGRPGGEYTSVDELVPPLGEEGTYVRDANGTYGPSEAKWSYSNPTDFHAGHISGAQRLANGNTLICSGEKGHLFEVTTGGAIVWDYMNPYGGDIRPPGPPPGPGRRGGPPMRRPGADGNGEPRRPRDGNRPAPPGRHPGGNNDARPPRGTPPPGHDETNAMFRATRLAPDYPGLRGHKLTSR